MKMGKERTGNGVDNEGETKENEEMKIKWEKRMGRKGKGWKDEDKVKGKEDRKGKMEEEKDRGKKVGKKRGRESDRK